MGNNVCEQVVRVWDIVLDHDNLSRAIDQTIERIEKSHKRGEDCAIWAEIDKKAQDQTVAADEAANGDGIRVPKYFAMSQEVTVIGTGKDEASKGKSKHFDPASDDPRQYTLLKFYELNEGAVKMLLDGKGNMDLPFTPGPKEHEIIHHRSDTPKSILLMGRSGTGKTTCLVFRMWAQYHEYRQQGQGSRPRQLFLTKNEVLCREVQRSFNNMGRAWRKRIESNDPAAIEPDWSTITDAEKPKFITSSEWLEELDVLLPGEHFFTQFELKQRVDKRKEKDSVTKDIEDYLSGRNVDDMASSDGREEMDFPKFIKLWKRKLRPSRLSLDSAIVWREIKSFIKGSIISLHIGEGENRSPQDRYLSLEEYLALGRKESRLDETQRREAYEIFLRYEKLKKEFGFYDEGDLVHNIAKRVSVLSRNDIEALAVTGITQEATQGVSLLPVDSLFCDEVQDFTQSELYILAKLCRDPNNLFLAGDTAQSISQGVDFRFTDVRQIFYNHFGGTEPDLLKLAFNYRSHAGVLRLAACVVELMYHFFGNSLDKLPPDLGLFNGPKPVIMDVANTEELVLMLDGSKRETSRIEFGAHQVVIVRSEEAKKSLPEEFGVDPDWVMTVQESKGLEFDDVLLYNFFSDSPAEDLWRVVSNYTEDDIKAYYSDATVAGSGIQKYDWDSPLLKDTRHLDFDVNSHKILEVELKMLYTAITRARVNVFIAETDSELSRPMFNYFQRRAVVDVVNKEGGLSSVRVFGAVDTIEDWKNRGEYYLRNAEGDRQLPCLRLAAKCFDKAGDIKRMNQTLAFLSFTEIENEDQKKLSKKQEMEYKEKLYNITEQLLEARDVGFLNKAALCLLRTGEHEEYTARMFELYAKLSYVQRISEDDSFTLPVAPTSHEKKYFSYAGKLFAKVYQSDGRFGLAVDCFRNYVSAGMYDEAAEMINSGTLIVKNKDFQRLYQLCLPSPEKMRDPTATFRKDFQRKKCLKVIEALKSAAQLIPAE
jgi:superfamily I DNA/RNA helicase